MVFLSQWFLSLLHEFWTLRNEFWTTEWRSFAIQIITLLLSNKSSGSRSNSLWEVVLKFLLAKFEIPCSRNRAVIKHDSNQYSDFRVVFSLRRSNSNYSSNGWSILGLSVLYSLPDSLRNKIDWIICSWLWNYGSCSDIFSSWVLKRLERRFF